MTTAAQNTLPNYAKMITKQGHYGSVVFDGSKKESMGTHGLLVKANNAHFDDIDLRHYETALIVRGTGFKAKRIRISCFSNDGWHQCANDFDVDELEVTVPLNLIPYYLKHPDTLQFIPLKNGKPDENGVIKNGRIGKISIVAVDSDSTQEHGIQGITCFTGTVENLRFGENGIYISSDIDQHGITFVHAINCTIGSTHITSQISAPSGTKKAGIVINDRKQNRVSSGNKIINLKTQFLDLKDDCECIDVEIVDTIEGQAVFETSSPVEANQPPKQLSINKDHIAQIAVALSCEFAFVRALIDVESGAKGFISDDVPVVKYEPHKFSKYTGGQFDAMFPSLSAPNFSAAKKVWCRGSYTKRVKCEFDKMQRANALSEEMGYLSTSFGYWQCMGFNYKQCGFDSVNDFVKAMSTSVDAQTTAFIAFIKSDASLLSAMQDKDFLKVTRIYNGNAQAKKYAAKLQKAYARYTRSSGRVVQKHIIKSRINASTGIGIATTVGAAITTLPTDTLTSSLAAINKTVDAIKDRSDQMEDLTSKVTEISEQVAQLAPTSLFDNPLFPWLVIIAGLFLFTNVRRYLDWRGGR